MMLGMRRAAAAVFLAACTTSAANTSKEPATPTGPTAPTATVSASPAPPPPPEPISETRLMSHVAELCAPELEGRRAFTPGEARAAAYLSRELDKIGVAPLAGKREHGFNTLAGHSVNVAGQIRCRGCAKADEWIVLGAHYDHEGIVAGEVYLGAEDNASGVAVVLEIARALGNHPEQLGRSVAIVFFGAEERGLHGSIAFNDQPPIDRMRAMVNVDMIGRPLADMAVLSIPKRLKGIDDQRSVGVLGTLGRPEFRRVVDEACRDSGIVAIAPEDLGDFLQRAIERMSRNRGDSFMFEHAGIPALFFSSGESADYHLPSDTPDKLVPAIMRARAEAIRRTVIGLSQLNAFPRATSR